MYEGLSLEEIEEKIRVTRVAIQTNKQLYINPFSFELVDLEDMRLKKLFEEGLYETDLSSYSTIESFTALNSFGEEVLIPLNGVIDISPDGKLWVSEFDYGTITWDHKKSSYKRTLKWEEELLDIVGFVDIIGEKKER